LFNRSHPKEGIKRTKKDNLQNAPRILGAMMVGGLIMGLPLAFLSYYAAYAVSQKYQRDIKEKLARQKARLSNTKERVKKRIRKRRKKK
jgi:hypothetical protein